MKSKIKHVNVDEFRNALCEEGGTYEAMHDLLAQDPLVLAYRGPTVGQKYGDGIYVPGLILAIKKNNLGQTKAILEVLSKKEIADKIVDEFRRGNRLSKECPLGHPFYAIKPSDNDTVYLPHAYVRSPEMFQLLHDHGYNLNTWGDKSYGSYIDITTDKFIEKFDDGVPSTELLNEIKPALCKAIELGMDVNSRKFESYAGPAGAAEYAFRKIEAKLEIDKVYSQTDIIAGFFAVFASAGIDCRNLLTIDAGIRFSASETRKRQYIRDMFRHKFVKAADEYGKRQSTHERQGNALMSCAGGTFPTLLNFCVNADVSSGDRKETTELLSYLDPYWQDQYKHVIHSAEATLARKLSFSEENALSRYMKHDVNPSHRGAS